MQGSQRPLACRGHARPQVGRGSKQVLQRQQGQHRHSQVGVGAVPAGGARQSEGNGSSAREQGAGRVEVYALCSTVHVDSLLQDTCSCMPTPVPSSQSVTAPSSTHRLAMGAGRFSVWLLNAAITPRIVQASAVLCSPKWYILLCCLQRRWRGR